MVGWSSIISLAIGLTLYKTIFGVNPGIIDSAIVGGISGGIGGVLAFLYQHFFGKHTPSILNIIDNILWFALFCIPGAILGTVVNGLINDNENGTIIVLSVMIVVAVPLTIRKIKKKEKLLKKDFFEDLH